MDLVIKNGTVVTAADMYPADVGIQAGKIAAIGEDLSGDRIIDAGDCLVFPGFVDPHVHLQMPVDGLTSTDTFLTGTIAAACGGTTTVIDFAQALRGASLLDAVGARRIEAESQIAVDYSLHLTGNSARRPDEIHRLAREGVTSLKLYTTYAGLMVDDDEILELLEIAGDAGMLPMVHAENDAAIQWLRPALIAHGHVSPKYFPLSRPCEVEAEAVSRVLVLAQMVRVPVYFVHVSCASTLQVIETARAAGQEVYAEVTPQHLLLHESEYDREGFEGAKYVCAPPLRAAEHLQALWRGLASGRIQTVATDHCPWNFNTDRRRGEDDFTLIPAGLPGIETRPALLFDRGVNNGLLSLNRFVDTCATTPAKLFGLYPQKGSIVIGGDADLVLWDPNREVKLAQNTLHQNVDYCPYEGWRVRGYPALVLLRGRPVAQDGQFVGRPGAGRFVPRRPYSIASRA
jgi:dihydropyrimidinase